MKRQDTIQRTMTLGAAGLVVLLWLIVWGINQP